MACLGAVLFAAKTAWPRELLFCARGAADCDGVLFVAGVFRRLSVVDCPVLAQLELAGSRNRTHRF